MRTADRPIMDERYADHPERHPDRTNKILNLPYRGERLPLDPEKDLRLPKPERSAT